MANLKKIHESQKDPVDTKKQTIDKTNLQLKVEQDEYEEKLKTIRSAMQAGKITKDQFSSLVQRGDIKLSDSINILRDANTGE